MGVGIVFVWGVLEIVWGRDDGWEVLVGRCLGRFGRELDCFGKFWRRKEESGGGILEEIYLFKE